MDWLLIRHTFHPFQSWQQSGEPNIHGRHNKPPQCWCTKCAAARGLPCWWHRIHGMFISCPQSVMLDIGVYHGLATCLLSWATWRCSLYLRSPTMKPVPSLKPISSWPFGLNSWAEKLPSYTIWLAKTNLDFMAFRRHLVNTQSSPYWSGSSFQFLGRFTPGCGHAGQNSASPPGGISLLGSCA